MSSHQPKKVLISSLYPQGYGGVYTALKLMVEILLQKGFEVKIAYYSPRSVNPKLSVPLRKMLRQMPGVEVFTGNFRVQEYAIGAMLPELEFTHYFPNRHWRKLIKEADYHIAVTGNALSALPFYLSKRRFIVWVAALYDEDRRNRVFEFPWYRRVFDSIFVRPLSNYLEKRILKAGKVLSFSEYSKVAFEKYLADISGVMPMPINTSDFFPLPASVQPFSVIFTGRFTDPRKNITFLLRAFSFFSAENQHAKLILVGDKLNTHIESLMHRLGIEDRVEVHARVSEEMLVALLQRADVFALPSYQEGLCISALEAMACGCPVVSTQCGGPADYIRPGINGDLLPFDVEAFAKALSTICANREIRHKMSEAAVSTVMSDYSRSRVEKVFDQCFGECYS